MPNFRYAKYNEDQQASAIDDPNKLTDLTPAQLSIMESQAANAGMSIVGSKKIKRLMGAIAQSSYRRTYIGMHSNSIGAGAYCDDGSPPVLDAAYHIKARTQSFGALLAKRLATAYGGTASCVAEPMCGIASATINPLFTPAGGAAFAQGSIAGPSYGAWITVSQTGRSVAFQAVGTSVKVWAITNNANTQARWTINAGAIQTAPPSGPHTATPMSSTALWWYEYVITGLTPGDTISLLTPALPIDPTSSIPYYIDLDYRPAEPGISMYRVCSSGQPLVFMHAASLDNTDVAGPSAWIGSTAAIVNQRLTQAQSMSARLGLDGVILQCDVNDLNTWNAATGLNFGYTLEDHRRHLRNYLDYHASLNLDVLVILGPLRDPTFSPSNRPYNQADLIEAYKGVISSKANAAYIDWTESFTGATLADRFASQGSLLVDLVHPGKYGHSVFGGSTATAFLTAQAA